jgi:hypothetical protein
MGTGIIDARTEAVLDIHEVIRRLRHATDGLYDLESIKFSVLGRPEYDPFAASSPDRAEKMLAKAGRTWIDLGDAAGPALLRGPRPGDSSSGRRRLS